MTNDIKSRTLTIQRTLDAPVALVWEAWTDPQHIARWWAPKGMAVTVVSHEFRPGGKWKYTMPMPDGSEFVSEGEYLEIVELVKIHSTANFRPMTEGVEIEALFEPAGDKTNFTFNVIHPTEAYARQQEQMGFYNGWGSAFERLNGMLSEPLIKN